MDSDELEEALAAFQEAARLDPQLAVAHSNMGRIYRRMGEYEQAIDSFVEAVRRNPFSFDDTFNLASFTISPTDYARPYRPTSTPLN